MSNSREASHLWKDYLDPKSDVEYYAQSSLATGADDLDECLDMDPKECPLLVYQLVNGVPDRSLPPILFTARTSPSDGDKAFVLKYYD